MSAYSYNWCHQAHQRLRELRANGDWWVFVKHNPVTNDLPVTLFKDVELVFWQLEAGSKSAKEHLQGAVKFLYPKSYSQVRKMLPTAWWHKMLGTPEEAIAYCTKRETRLLGPWAFMPADTELVRAWKTLESTQLALSRRFDQGLGVPETPDEQSEPHCPPVVDSDVTAS